MVFIGLFWTNTLTYYYDMGGTELFELCDTTDGESEKEEQKSEEDLDDKVRMLFSSIHLGIENLLSPTRSSLFFHSIHPPEITTPPPEQKLS